MIEDLMEPLATATAPSADPAATPGAAPGPPPGILPSVLSDAPSGVLSGAMPLASLRHGLLAATMLLPVALADAGWSTPAAAQSKSSQGTPPQSLPPQSMGTQSMGTQSMPTQGVAPRAGVMPGAGAATTQSGADTTPDVAPPDPTAAAAPPTVGMAGGGGGAAPLAAPIVPLGADVPAGASAVQVLVQQAQFWLDQSAPDKAVDALDRAMQLDPHNPDVFAVLAQLQADTGNRKAATASLAQLRQLRPNDPRIAKLDGAIRIGLISPDDLQNARDLAAQRRSAESIAAYQRMFKGNPAPDRLAIEYYQTLAGVPGGWEQARAGLGQLVIEAPRNLKAQLAYAELLTYQEPTRAEGIQRLMQLVNSPAVGQQADQSLHQAMLWLPTNANSVPTLQAYLQTHPTDAEVGQRLADAQDPRRNFTDPVGQARQSAFEALNAGKLDLATQLFESVLNTNPQDPDALGGLGIVRLREGKRREAETLLTQAMQLDPEHRDRWDSALQAAVAVYGKGGANLAGQYAQVRVLAERGDFAAAEQLLSRITNGRGNAGMSLMLGDVEARAGRLPEAEANYRIALRSQPNNGMTMIGLADVMMRQGRTADAEDLFTRAKASGNQSLVAHARSEELRQRALLVSDPGTRAVMYRAANAADPSNAWIRLEFARALVKTGQVREARTLMLDATEGRAGGGDNLKAALIYAQEQNDGPAAQQLLAHIPAHTRNAEMQAFADQAQAQSEVTTAATLYRTNPAAARARLLAMAAVPDPSGNRAAQVVHAMQQAGDTAAARQAINAALAANPHPTASGRLSFAGTLLSVGETSEASAMVAEADTSRLSADQRTQADGLRTGIAVRSSDSLNQRGNQAAAFDQLAPVLAQQPDNADANMALARLYQGADKPRRALEISINLLRQDPNNLDVRRQAIDAALSANDYRTADRLAREATEGQPNEVKSWLMAASVAKARGETSRAVHDLETARNLRRQQVGSSSRLEDSFRRTTARHPHVELTQSVGSAAALPLTDEASPTAPNPGLSTAPPTAYAPPHDYTPPPRRAASSLPPTATRAATPAATLAATPADVSGAASTQSATADGSDNAKSTVRRRRKVAASDTMPRPLDTGLGALPAAAPSPVAPAAPYPLVSDPSAGLGPQNSELTNPFRRPNMAVTPGAPYITNGSGANDPMVADIDRQIADLQAQAAPQFEAGFALRTRTGTAGEDKLTELMAPIEASFSPGGGPALIKLQATPTYITANKATASYALNGVGTNPLYALAAGPQPSQGHTQDNGVGLDAAFMWHWVSADVGSTPLGFQKTNIIGGVELVPPIGPDSRFRLTLERRAVTDSVLSYSGEVDPRTGRVYGAVTRSRAHGQIEGGTGKLTLYAGAGYSIYQGENVLTNNEIDAGVGGAYEVYKDPNARVTVGLDLLYFGYEHNLHYFTLGQGGYFSPQSYTAALVPVNYTGTYEDLTYTLGGAVGYQTFHENSSNVFPNDAALQAQLTAQSGTTGSVAPVSPSRNGSGFSGGAHGSIDYRIATNLHVGANASIQKAGDFTESNALVYARYIFDGAH